MRQIKGAEMLARWCELLPLFVVRWLAQRHCERWSLSLEGQKQVFAIARPDVLFNLEPAKKKAGKKTKKGVSVAKKNS